MDGNWYLVLRVLHILVAALWVGAAGMLAWIVLPAIREAGPAGGQFLVSLHKRKLHVFMAASAVLTVLSGIWLYWVLTAGFEQAIVWSRSGMIFGIGGLCGLLALILGGSVMGPGMKRAVAMAEQTSSLPADQHAAHMQRVGVMQQRTALVSRIALGLIVIALVLMALGHYV